MKLIDINYSVNDTTDLKTVIRMYRTSFGYLPHINKLSNVEAIVHLSKDDCVLEDGVNYKGFFSKKGFFYIPFKSYHYIKLSKPDVVFVQGLVFPIQVFALRFALGRKVKIIAQHHGGNPYRNVIKKFFLKLADRCIDAYLFTAIGNTQLWIEQGVIKNTDKCYEVLEASSFLIIQDRQLSKTKLELQGDDTIFLWVGRLNANKDPLTILKGFEKYCVDSPGVRLYMIYQDNDMLTDIQQLIDESIILRNSVILVGQIDNEELAYWYSAADFFISGSHNEGSGYALIESMACGCIPVVTDIPPFRNITNNGQLALLFDAGDVDSLTKVLQQSESINRKEMSAEILRYFSSRLSFKAIADDIYDVCQKLLHNC
jgi:glycosyltransferase involved in cell wall biosynthesis